MSRMFPGIGTVVNISTVLVGTGLGVLPGNRLALRTRELVTDALGLVTLLIAAVSAMAVLDDSLAERVGSSAPMLIVLGSLLVGDHRVCPAVGAAAGGLRRQPAAAAAE